MAPGKALSAAERALADGRSRSSSMHAKTWAKCLAGTPSAPAYRSCSLRAWNASAVDLHATGSDFGVSAVASGCQKQTRGERGCREHGPFHRCGGVCEGVGVRVRAFDDRPPAASFSRTITTSWPTSLHSRPLRPDVMDLSTTLGRSVSGVGS
jgi:hypothetical protein